MWYPVGTAYPCGNGFHAAAAAAATLALGGIDPGPEAAPPCCANEAEVGAGAAALLAPEGVPLIFIPLGSKLACRLLSRRACDEGACVSWVADWRRGRRRGVAEC